MDTFHHNQNGTLLLHKETGCPLSTMVLTSPQNRTPRVTNLKFPSQASKCKIMLKNLNYFENSQDLRIELKTVGK